MPVAAAARMGGGHDNRLWRVIHHDIDDSRICNEQAGALAAGTTRRPDRLRNPAARGAGTHKTGAVLAALTVPLVCCLGLRSEQFAGGVMPALRSGAAICWPPVADRGWRKN